MRRPPAPPPRAACPDGGPALAVLLTGADALAAVERRCRDALPRASVWACRDPGGADGGRDALLRRFLAAAEADVYLVCFDAHPDDVDAYPRLAAAVAGGLDLAVLRGAGDAGREPGARLLARAGGFAFGHGGEALLGGAAACSRRLARSYRRPPAGPVAGQPSLNLALHALRLRLPTGCLDAPAAGERRPAPHGLLAAAALAARILAEERPRRSFGLLGLALVAAGLALALPDLAVSGARASLAPGATGLAALAMIGTGGVSGAAGLLLDAVAAARQEVARVGLSALPGLADGDHTISA